MEIKNNKKDNSIYEGIILKDLLLSEKYLSSLYNEYINEFSNRKISIEFESMLGDINNIIRDINDLLFSLGYNKYEVSNESNIDRLIYNFNSRKM